MKKYLHLLILAIIAIAAGCIEDKELEPPQMTISYDPTEYITFSWREPAVLNVKIQSEEDIEKFTMTSKPAYWTKDSVFPPFTHYANFDLHLSLQQGYVVEDSTVQLTFRAYCNGLCEEQFRKLKYEFHYPAIDSFDVEMSPDPISGNCLLSIDDKEAFKYTEYRNRKFDLVLVKDTRKLYQKVGTAFASPTSEFYLYEYFKDKVPDFEYNADLSNLPFNETRTGTTSGEKYVRLTWDQLSPEIIDDENGFVLRYLNGEDENYGYGLDNIEISTFYKLKLNNGKKAMLRVMEIIDNTYPTVKIRVYYQKD